MEENRYETIYRLSRNWAERTAEETGYPLPSWEVSYVDALLELKGCVSEPITSDDTDMCRTLTEASWNRLRFGVSG